MKLFKPKQSFETREVADHRHRAAAEIIDERVGKKRDHEVTAKDLNKAERLLTKHNEAVAAGTPDKSPLAMGRAVAGEIGGPSEADLLTEALPHLKSYLHTEAETRRRGPFATTVRVGAIRDPEVAKCAAFIAACFGSGADELNLSELGAARVAFEASKRGSLDPKLAEKMDATTNRGALTEDHLAELELFFNHGKGGLVSHGPISINGRPYHDVFAVPTTPNVPEVKDDKTAAALIEEYEQRLGDCGYDRIYVHTDDNRILVALNESGALDRVHPKDRIQLGTSGNYVDSARVARVVDVANSMHEATLGFWRKVIGKAVGAIRGKILANLDRDINSGTSKVADAKKAEASDKVDIKELAVGAGVVASMGAAFFNIPGAVMVAAGTGGVVTAMNVIDYVATGHDLSAVYHAAGVTLNRDERIVY